MHTLTQYVMGVIVILALNFHASHGASIAEVEQSGDPVLIDPRLFTVFALLNAAGFDTEYRKEGMHPVRIAVRQELLGLSPDLAQQITDYTNARPRSNWMHFARYALMIQPPPDFSPREQCLSSETINELGGFDELLRQFYREAHIDSLWNLHRPSYEEVATTLRTVYAKSVKLMWDYSRVPLEQRHAAVRVVPNLLYSFHCATLFRDVASDTLFVIRGPLTQEDTVVDDFVIHELLHALIKSSLNSNQDLVDRSASLLSLVAEISTVRDDYGGSYRQVVEESLVRAVEKRILLSEYDEGLVTQALDREYRQGFILVWPFYEMLAEGYEKGYDSLVATVPTLLGKIDVQKEKDRWGHRDDQ